MIDKNIVFWFYIDFPNLVCNCSYFCHGYLTLLKKQIKYVIISASLNSHYKAVYDQVSLSNRSIAPEGMF